MASTQHRVCFVPSPLAGVCDGVCWVQSWHVHRGLWPGSIGQWPQGTRGAMLSVALPAAAEPFPRTHHLCLGASLTRASPCPPPHHRGETAPKLLPCQQTQIPSSSMDP